MLSAMDIRKTVLERAFELARSGKFANLSDISRRLIRPSAHEWNRIKREKLLAAGLTEADKNRFELDYIIPPSLGGAPDNPNNFQLKPGNEVSQRKALEDCLPRLVCERRLLLDEVRKAVWRDWRAALSLCRD
jgi:hypothetical protein